jgi:peptide/nickel transport system ATP-binding protein/oligopeptide transport system ATP-binding protein
MREMSKPLLTIQDLKMYFFTRKGAVKAVDGINLEVRDGEMIGVVGESGCGKTMTAFSVLGLVPNPGKIINGEILFKDRNLLKLTKSEMRSIRGKEISMIFQDPLTYLNPVLKVEDQISENLLLHTGINKTEAKKRVIEILEMVGLPSPTKIAQYYPHQLSGGMRQRVMIAMAISCNPSLLIADEPTTFLDVTIQAQILNLLKELVKTLGVSLLMITHDLGIVAEICDKVYVMYCGKIVESADVFSIYDNCKHPYTIGLLNSVLSIDEFKVKITAIKGSVPGLINPPSGCRFHPRCEKRLAICSEKEPMDIEIEPGHMVSCWLYV